jgi:hypothetical protein
VSAINKLLKTNRISRDVLNFFYQDSIYKHTDMWPSLPPENFKARMSYLQQNKGKILDYIEGMAEFNESVEQGVAEGSLDEKSTSQAQFRTMAAAAHNPEFARKVGIKQSVAKEFNRADKGQDYKSLPKKADESKKAPAEKEADYGDDYQDMVRRVKKLAGLGPLKTQYDPAKRVYRNMPTAVQPKK